jgi:hypothetical protein
MHIAYSNKSTPHELMAEVELRLASTPGFESQFRNILSSHPPAPQDAAEAALGLERHPTSIRDIKA